MSAMLLGLAWKARLDTNRKIVLMRLVDAAEDDGTRIFPSKETIARDTGLGVRTVQRILREFEGEGLLRIVGGAKGGRRPGDGRRGRSTEYRMILGVLWGLVERSMAEDPVAGGEPEDGGEGETKGATVTPSDGKGATGDAERVPPETLKGATAWHTTPPDPSSDPSIEREARARAIGSVLCRPDPEPDEADADPPDAGDAADGRTLDDFRAVWPHVAQDDQTLLARKWAELTPQERAEAIDGVERWLADRKAAGAKGGIYGWKYLAEKRWRLVPQAAAGRPCAATGHAGPPKIDFPAWSRGCWLVVCRRAAAGDKIGAQRAVSFAKQKLPVRVEPVEAPDEVALGACVAMQAGSAEFVAWRDWLSERRVSLPIFDDEMWCHMPARRPGEWRDGR